MKVVAVSGYFDPIHVGHLEYLKMAKNLGDKLIVIVNSDYQAGLKKGTSFMPEDDRLEIVKSLRCVDEVVEVSGAEEFVNFPVPATLRV